jgi:hypothetical protein
MAKRKSKYGSKGKKFIGSTRSGEIVYEGQGRKGKRGKYFKRGDKGRVGAVSQQQGIEATRRGVPVPLGQRGATIRSLAIPAQPPGPNLSSPPTRTGTSVSKPRLRRRTSLKDQRPKVVGSGSGIINKLKIPSSIKSTAQKAIGFLRGKTGAASLAVGAWDLGKHIGEVQHMGSQLKAEKEAKARAGEITNLKYKGPVSKKKPSTKSTNAVAVKPKVQVKSTPKIENPKQINKKIVANTTKKKTLSGFAQEFKKHRYGKGGYEGKEFSYKGKKYIAVTKDDLKKRGLKNLGEYQKRAASLKKLKKKGLTMRKPYWTWTT